MSTANFKTQVDFPLYVHGEDEFYMRRCPECGLANSAEAETCECGADLTRCEYIWDDIEAEYFFDSIMNRCEELSDKLLFHKITAISGYYSGMQLYVELTDNVYYLEDNEDCKCYMGMYKSQAQRKYEAEQNKVNRLLEKIAEEYNFYKIRCVGVFSNGEAVYERV